MWESLRPFFEWHDHTCLAQQIAASVWIFPAIETVHILAMAVLFGSLMVINLRLLGLGMRRQPVSLLAETLSPYVNWGLALMLLSGYVMFTSEAVKCFLNDGFKFKMIALGAVLLFQYTVYPRLVRQEEWRRPKLLGGMAALLSFALWFAVGAGGRAIGFV